MSSVQETIGNPQWVVQHYVQVRDIFPAERQLMTQSDMIRVGFKMKLLGIDWRSENELAQVMVLCYHLGMYHQQVGDSNCVYVTRSQALIPPADFFKMSPAQLQANRILRSTPPPEIQDLAMQLINGIMYKSQR